MGAAQLAQVIAGLVPELIQWISGFHAATGTLPTDAQVIAKFQTDANSVIARGTAWLAANPPAPPTV
jgi:hypothetical protein